VAGAVVARQQEREQQDVGHAPDGVGHTIGLRSKNNGEEEEAVRERPGCQGSGKQMGRLPAVAAA
jgi:hypothetical protein